MAKINFEEIASNIQCSASANATGPFGSQERADSFSATVDSLVDMCTSDDPREFSRFAPRKLTQTEAAILRAMPELEYA